MGMLRAMLDGLTDVVQKKTSSQHPDACVYIFLPESPPLLPNPEAKIVSPRIFFIDKALGRKGSLLELLRRKGIEVLWRENVENASVAAEILSQDVVCVATNQRRDPDGDSAGLGLCSLLRAGGFMGNVALYSSHLDDDTGITAWLRGANLVTEDLDELQVFLEQFS